MALAANLRLLRKKAGLTQIELAEKLGVSIATLRRWESGETAPTGTRIMELANLLKVSPDEVINDAETPPNSMRVLTPAHEASGGMLVYEGEGTRIELPPTEKGFELFKTLIDNMMRHKKEAMSKFVSELKPGPMPEPWPMPVPVPKPEPEPEPKPEPKPEPVPEPKPEPESESKPKPKSKSKSKPKPEPTPEPKAEA